MKELQFLDSGVFIEGMWDLDVYHVPRGGVFQIQFFYCLVAAAKYKQILSVQRLKNTNFVTFSVHIWKMIPLLIVNIQFLTPINLSKITRVPTSNNVDLLGDLVKMRAEIPPLPVRLRQHLYLELFAIVRSVMQLKQISFIINNHKLLRTDQHHNVFQVGISQLLGYCVPFSECANIPEYLIILSLAQLADLNRKYCAVFKPI